MDLEPANQSQQNPPDYRRPKTLRLRTTAEFRKCYDAGYRAGDNHLLLFADVNDDDHPRGGVSVSKKHGNAVQRNRKKRLLREAIRLSQHELAALDYVLVPRQGEPATLEQYQKSLVMLAGKLARRIQRDGEREEDTAGQAGSGTRCEDNHTKTQDQT